MAPTTARTSATTPPASPGPPSSRGDSAVVARARELGIVVAFAALFVGLSIASPAFLTTTNLLNLLAQSATVGIIACGGTLVIIAGGFDLSVGAVFALSGIVAAEVANRVDPIAGLLAAALVGLVLGVVNGGAVTVLRVNSFIATLASGYVFRGIATLLTGGFIVSVADPDFVVIGSDQDLLGLPVPVWLFALTAVLCGFVLSRTVLGRYIYAIGGNAEAARLSGIRVNMVRAFTFIVSGLCAGVAGAIAASTVSSGQANTGVGLELAAIAAIVVGGTSIAGGEGAMWRSVLGVLLIAMIGNGFNLLNVEPFYQSVVQGLIILVAVALDGWSRRRGARAAARQARPIRNRQASPSA